MKIGSKSIILLCLVAMLTSCNSFMPTPAMTSTDVTGTANSTIKTAVVEIQAEIPTDTPLPPIETSIPVTQSSPIPVSSTPTIIVMENGITWTECVAPSDDYAHSRENDEFASRCLNMQMPLWDDNDRKIAGEWISTATSSNNADLQQVIGNDVFLVRQDGTNGCCDYEFLKNGKVIIKTHVSLVTFNPNQHLWSIDGKSVWELVTDPPTIIVDGVDLNKKYQLEGIFKPYTIQNKLIYIAKQNGKYHIVYDKEIIGPEFDEIYIKYCCGTTNVRYGKGQYWFWGKRDGTYYVVAIY